MGLFQRRYSVPPQIGDLFLLSAALALIRGRVWFFCGERSFRRRKLSRLFFFFIFGVCFSWVGIGRTGEVDLGGGRTGRRVIVRGGRLFTDSGDGLGCAAIDIVETWKN